MTTTTEILTEPAVSPARQRALALVARASGALNILGFGWLVPILRMAAGEDPVTELRALRQLLLIPLAGIATFLLAWAWLAPMVNTSLGAVPGPAEVWEQAEYLYNDHVAERQKEEEFYARQDERNAKLIEAGHADRVKERAYTGRPTYFDQIITSLETVALGFLIATLVAVPLGIFCGLSKSVSAAFNPLIQIFKPVSPLAWLPIVTMVVSALYVDVHDALPKSLLVSAITVTLCSLWPTLINTTHGVGAVDKDLMNVARVLRLSTARTVTRVILPSALPLIFTGLRLSLGVGWMVLIAAEMLAQNPGLGKFVWDEFQNGSSSSLAKIIVAVLTIGLIGFLLDRLMYALQSAFTFSATR
ncbi:MAG: ABC transporter permease [Pseudomonadota bacterium]|nr:ABC transporter permease [Pseudomonadota bacterium]